LTGAKDPQLNQTASAKNRDEYPQALRQKPRQNSKAVGGVSVPTALP